MTMLTRRDPTSFSALFPRDPFGFFRDEFDNMLSRFGNQDGQWANQFLTPQLDISESDGAVNVSMDIPGMKADDFEVQVRDRVLTISGERVEEKEDRDGKEGNGKFHRVERRMGQFARSVALPCGVDESKIEATYHNGVLHVMLPKSADTRSHKIKVQEKADAAVTPEATPAT